MDESKLARKERIVSLYSGGGLGLLLGVIMGLSVSPVVATVLGALATLLGSLLGLQGGEPPTAETPEVALKALSRRNVSGLRLGSFGFACVAGIFLGLFIRSNEVLSVDTKKLVTSFEDAGYDKKSALDLAAFQKLGLVPAGRQVQYTETQKALQGNLYEGLAKIDFCGDVSMKKFGNDVNEVLKAYRRQDNEQLKRLADELAALQSSEERKNLVVALENVLCNYNKAVPDNSATR